MILHLMKETDTMRIKEDMTQNQTNAMTITIDISALMTITTNGIQCRIDAEDDLLKPMITGTMFAVGSVAKAITQRRFVDMAKKLFVRTVTGAVTKRNSVHMNRRIRWPAMMKAPKSTFSP